MEIISDVEGMQEATVMTMESSTQRPTIDDVEEVTAVMNTGAVTENTNLSEAQEVTAMPDHGCGRKLQRHQCRGNARGHSRHKRHKY